MRSGQLRHRVTIRKPVETQNSYGEPIVRWQDVATGVWASIEPLSGREFMAAKQLVSEIEVRIRIRYLAGLSAKMKIVDANSNSYLIESIINIEERNRELQLMCSRIIE